jgi:hypothetical protein
VLDFFFFARRRYSVYKSALPLCRCPTFHRRSPVCGDDGKRLCKPHRQV